MKRTIWVLAAWVVLLGGTAARAANISLTVTTTMVPIDPPVTLTNNAIGTITALTANNGGGKVFMKGTFTLSPQAQALMFCSTFHWVQIVTHTAAGSGNYYGGKDVATITPFIDTPSGGYQNMAGMTLAGQNEDNIPWYLTTAEESEARNTTPGVPGGIIRDSPSVTAATFNTYLVATDPDDSPTTFIVIAGYTWTTGTDGGAANLALINGGTGAAAQADVDMINTALGNSGFGTWTAQLASTDDLDLCPEPASMTLLLIGGGLAFGRQFVRRKRAA